MKKRICFRLTFLTALVFGLVLAVPGYSEVDTKTDSSTTASLQKVKIKGVILKREADSFSMRDPAGKELIVTLTDQTEVREKKSNPFRASKSYSATQLLRGQPRHAGCQQAFSADQQRIVTGTLRNALNALWPARLGKRAGSAVENT